MFGKLVTAGALALALAPAAYAENIDVLMLNRGEEGSMVFEPAFINAAIGDTITFIPTDRGHNVESIDGMLPEGVEEFKSGMNVEYVLTIETDGVIGVKCTPHYALGMVALIQVGEATNLDEVLAVNLRGKAKKRFAPLFEMVQ